MNSGRISGSVPKERRFNAQAPQVYIPLPAIMDFVVYNLKFRSGHHHLPLSSHHLSQLTKDWKDKQQGSPALADQ